MMTNPYTEHSAAELKNQTEWELAAEMLKKNANSIHQLIADFCEIRLTHKEEFEESCCDPTVGYHYDILFDGENRLNGSWPDEKFMLRAWSKLTAENKVRFNEIFKTAEKRFEKENWIQSSKYENALALSFLKLIQENIHE